MSVLVGEGIFYVRFCYLILCCSYVVESIVGVRCVFENFCFGEIKVLVYRCWLLKVLIWLKGLFVRDCRVVFGSECW